MIEFLHYLPRPIPYSDLEKEKNFETVSIPEKKFPCVGVRPAEAPNFAVYFRFQEAAPLLLLEVLELKVTSGWVGRARVVMTTQRPLAHTDAAEHSAPARGSTVQWKSLEA